MYKYFIHLSVYIYTDVSISIYRDVHIFALYMYICIIDVYVCELKYINILYISLYIYNDRDIEMCLYIIYVYMYNRRICVCLCTQRESIHYMQEWILLLWRFTMLLCLRTGKDSILPLHEAFTT